LGKARRDDGPFLFGAGKPKTLFLAKDKSKKMGYSSGFLAYIIIPMNRKKADAGKYGIDAAGIEWEEVGCLHANVDYQKGKSALNAGALDAYAVKIVRMRWTNLFNERSRIKFDGKVYQIIPETFNANRREDTLQFLMQLVVND
jgi:head-tail adaptor